MGARYIPCMKTGTGYDVPGATFPCPSGLKGTAKNGTACMLSDICNLGKLASGEPNQWWRFITPIFLHGGVLHLLFNLSFQLQGGFDLEKVSFCNVGYGLVENGIDLYDFWRWWVFIWC
jgi:hypothetical protein